MQGARKTRYRAVVALGRLRILQWIVGVCLVTSALCWRPAAAGGQDAPSAPTSIPEGEGTIVFVIPSDLDTGTRTSLEEALLASLSLVRAHVVLVSGPSSRPPIPLEERIPISVRLAKQNSAKGVLWLDVRLTDHWFLYAMDAEAERVVVRPLLVRTESVPAAVESIAVISRASAQALMQGEPVQGEPVVQPAPPPPTAAPPAPPPTAPSPAPTAAPASSRLQLSLAYLGTTFASQQPWQSGLQLGAAWAWRSGLLLSLGYAWIPAHRFGDELVFSVQRRPFCIGGGWALRFGESLTVTGSLGATIDIQSRHTVKVPSGTAAEDDATRILVAASPTATAQLDISPWLAAFVGLGADVFLNDFDYVGGAGGEQTLLDADRARLRALAGVAILH